VPAWRKKQELLEQTVVEGYKGHYYGWVNTIASKFECPLLDNLVFLQNCFLLIIPLKVCVVKFLLFLFLLDLFLFIVSLMVFSLELSDKILLFRHGRKVIGDVSEGGA